MYILCKSNCYLTQRTPAEQSLTKPDNSPSTIIKMRINIHSFCAVTYTPCPAQTQQHFFCSAPSPQDWTRHGTYWRADFVEVVLSYGFGSWGLDNMTHGRRKYFLHGLLSLICGFQFWKLQIMPMSLLMFVWRMFPIIAHPRDPTCPDLGMVLRKARCPRSMALSCLLHMCSPCCRLFPSACGPSLGVSLFVIKKTQQPTKKKLDIGHTSRPSHNKSLHIWKNWNSDQLTIGRLNETRSNQILSSTPVASTANHFHEPKLEG